MVSGISSRGVWNHDIASFAWYNCRFWVPKYRHLVVMGRVNYSESVGDIMFSWHVGNSMRAESSILKNKQGNMQERRVSGWRASCAKESWFVVNWTHETLSLESWIMVSGAVLWRYFVHPVPFIVSEAMVWTYFVHPTASYYGILVPVVEIIDLWVSRIPIFWTRWEGRM